MNYNEFCVLECERINVLTLDSLEMATLGDIASSKSQKNGVYGVCGAPGVFGVSC